MHGYNFTEGVRRALASAREETARLRHEYVGTEHLLLGLMLVDDGAAANVLRKLNIDLVELRLDVESRARPGTTAPRDDAPYTTRAKKVLELAMSEARELGDSFVGTEHVLLGLIGEQ